MKQACATCERQDSDCQTILIPIIGMVCHECYWLLSKPMLMDGAIEGPSILTLCRSTVREFEMRRGIIRNKARLYLESKGQ